MNLDDSTLIAYVDGELDAAQAASIEAELAESPELQTSVHLLRASRVDYASAFATQKLPPTPPDLLRRIEAMASAAQAAQPARSARSAQGTAQPEDAKAKHDADATSVVPDRLAGAPAANERRWLVAAFVAGAFCAGLVLQFGSALIHPSGNGALTTASAEPVSWIHEAADYQRLYTRDTVADVSVDMNESAKTVDAIRHVDGMALRVPDLRGEGISFKSVARLRFNDKPLVQIVYLPEHGDPIALCVMKDSRPDQATVQTQVSGMKVVSWRQNELTYALIARPDSTDLEAIAQQILTSRVDAMFAAAEPATLRSGAERSESPTS